MELNWKYKDHWGMKELLLLLVIEFGIVVFVMKYFIQPIISRLFSDELYAGTLIGLMIAAVLLVSLYIIAIRPKGLSWSEVGINSFHKKDWKLIILSTLLVMVVVVLITLFTTFIGGTWENSKTEAVQRNISAYTVLIAFVSAAVISPIYEEIFYRGFLFGWFRTRFGFVGGAICSSFIFSIVHIPTYNVIPVAFFSGIIFAYAYEKTNSIWPSVLIHGLSNGIMLLLTITA